MPVDIALTEQDLLCAECEAQRRQTYNENKGLKGRNRAPSRGEAALDMHRLGCVGELVVAKYLGLEDHVFGNERPVRGSADLPGSVEIKTRSKHSYDLLIQLNDDPSKLFVLVTYEKTVNHLIAKIVGWTYGFDVMQKQYIREFVRGRPCYAVPQGKLKKPESLRQELTTPTKTGRNLGPDDIWMTFDNDEMILNFNQKVIDELGWSGGNTLHWSVDPVSGVCSLRKADDSKTSL